MQEKLEQHEKHTLAQAGNKQPVQKRGVCEEHKENVSTARNASSHLQSQSRSMKERNANGRAHTRSSATARDVSGTGASAMKQECEDLPRYMRPTAGRAHTTRAYGSSSIRSAATSGIRRANTGNRASYSTAEGEAPVQHTTKPPTATATATQSSNLPSYMRSTKSHAASKTAAPRRRGVRASSGRGGTWR